MPFEILIPLIVAGLTLVAVFLRYLGLSREVVLGDLEQAEAVLLTDYPDAVVDKALLEETGKTALFKLVDGRIGLVVVMADRFVTRVLRKADIASVEITGTASIALRLSDFTLPQVRCQCGETEEAERATAWLGGNQNA